MAQSLALLKGATSKLRARARCCLGKRCCDDEKKCEIARPGESARERRRDEVCIAIFVYWREMNYPILQGNRMFSVVNVSICSNRVKHFEGESFVSLTRR